MLVTPPCGASSNIALWRAKIKPPVELVVGDLEIAYNKFGHIKNIACKEKTLDTHRKIRYDTQGDNEWKSL